MKHSTPQQLIFLLVALFICKGVYAANKTGVTDFLSKGNDSFSLSYTTASATLLSGSTPSTINSGASIAPLAGLITQNTWLATINIGVTDKTNMHISYGMQSERQEFDYAFAPNDYAVTSKWEGSINPEIGFQSLLADKNKGEVGAILYGSVSPAMTPGYAPIPEIKTNGVLTSGGSNGGSGNDYTTIRIGSTVSMPVYIGSAYFNIEYIYGFVTSIAMPHGTDAQLTFGVEHNFGDSATLRPYISASAIGSSYYGPNLSASYSKYDIGAVFINDISPRFSLEYKAEYSTLNNEVIYYANGNVITLATNSFTLGVQGIFFFH